MRFSCNSCLIIPLLTVQAANEYSGQHPEMRLGSRSQRGLQILLTSRRMSEVIEAVRHLGMCNCKSADNRVMGAQHVGNV